MFGTQVYRMYGKGQDRCVVVEVVPQRPRAPYLDEVDRGSQWRYGFFCVMRVNVVHG